MRITEERHAARRMGKAGWIREIGGSSRKEREARGELREKTSAGQRLYYQRGEGPGASLHTKKLRGGIWETFKVDEFVTACAVHWRRDSSEVKQKPACEGGVEKKESQSSG